MSEEETLQCPRDGTDLIPRNYEENVQVDSCSTCRGMWLDAGELEAIQEATEQNHSDVLIKGEDAHAPPVAPRDPIACPVCGVTMEAREYAYCSGVVVDTCVEGCGLWLDEGEIQALERFFERAQRPGLWSTLTTLLDEED